MGLDITITGKISRETKEKIDKYNINASKVIREAFEREIECIEQEKILNMLDAAGKAISKIGKEEVVKTLREDRDGEEK